MKYRKNMYLFFRVKYFLFVILFLPSILNAEWRTYFIGDDDSKAFYDSETVNFNNGYYYVWTLNTDYDPQMLDGKFHKSFTAYTKLDCEIYRWGFLSLNFYSEKMGNGNRIFEVDIDDFDWEFAEPNTNGNLLLQTICK